MRKKKPSKPVAYTRLTWNDRLVIERLFNNGHSRRYLPRGKSLRKITQAQCNLIADDINDMPRKILGYATARELFEQELAKLTT